MRKLTLDLTGINTINVIEYKISKFPDGQQTIDIQDTIFHPDDVITIKSRLNNFKHLELIICANQALKNLGVKDIELYVPYFVGGRSDRKFQVGGVHYLKQVIAPIINLQGFSKVTVMDPHSDVLESVLNNYEKISNFNLIKWSLSKIDNKNGAQDRVTLISPDAGAYKKIFDVAQHFKIPNVITANKVRDVITGEMGKTFVIIDDICDGGRTFLEIAKAIRSTLSISSVSPEPCKIYLIVTHGIFSKSFLELSQHIDGIFSTNSVRDIDCEEDSQYTVSAGYLQQYNVF
jgi:ribose-phosphate pyrophosphokinase